MCCGEHWVLELWWISPQYLLFELACLGRAQDLAVRKPVSVRQAVCPFPSFSGGQSPYGREVGGRFSTNGEICFKINIQKGFGESWQELLRCYKLKYFLCFTSTEVNGKSKFYQAHNLDSCTWFIVNFGELWQVAWVTEKKQSTEECRAKRLSSKN